MKYLKIINMHKKGGGTPIVIGLLVIAYFVLLGFAWQSLSVKETNLKLRLTSPDVLEKVYIKQSQINLLIEDLLIKSADNTENRENQKSLFIQNIKNELPDYKERYPQFEQQLNQIEPQLIEEKISISDEKISVNLKIKIEETLKDYRYQLLAIEYIYEKEFIVNFS